MKDEILRRNDAHARGDVARIDGATLLAAARKRDDFPSVLTRAAAIPRSVAAQIMADASGLSLAVVVKGAGLTRPVYSGICILTLAAPLAALSVYDRVPRNGASNLLAFWRAQLDASLARRDVAA